MLQPWYDNEWGYAARIGDLTQTVEILRAVDKLEVAEKENIKIERPEKSKKKKEETLVSRKELEEIAAARARELEEAFMAKRKLLGGRKVRVGINGMAAKAGRLDQLILYQLARRLDEDIEIVWINGVSDRAAYADSIQAHSDYGQLDNPIEHGKDKNGVDFVMIGGYANISLYDETDPSGLPTVDCVFELGYNNKGKPYEKEGVTVIDLSEDTAVASVIPGVTAIDPNKDAYAPASPMETGVSTVLSAIRARYGIKIASLWSVMAVKYRQVVLDRYSEAAAAANILPADVPVSETFSRTLKEEGIPLAIEGMTVPTTSGDCYVLKIFTDKKVKDDEEVNKVLEAALEGTDIVMEDAYTTAAARGRGVPILDRQATKVIDGHIIVAVIWADDQWGRAAAAIDLLKEVALERVKQGIGIGDLSHSRAIDGGV